MREILVCTTTSEDATRVNEVLRNAGFRDVRVVYCSYNKVEEVRKVLDEEESQALGYAAKSADARPWTMPIVPIHKIPKRQ